MSEVLDPVNERLTPGELVPPGLQQARDMCPGAVAVPLGARRVQGFKVVFDGSCPGGESDARHAALAAEGSL